MAFVHFRGYEATPAPAEAGQCPRCRGLGQAPGGPQTDPGPCSACDSTGRIVYSGLRPERRAVTDRRPFYLAVQGVDTLDVGMSLERLAAEVVAGFPELSGDVVLWMTSDSLCGEPRVVGLVRPGRDGKPAVTWLGG
jgi:hypothetical protein